MTHPITGHSDRCLCERCEQVVDAPTLLAELALLRDLEGELRNALPGLANAEGLREDWEETFNKLDELRANPAPTPRNRDRIGDLEVDLERAERTIEEHTRSLADLRRLVHEINQRTIGVAK